jgi:hypothetical protein
LDVINVPDSEVLREHIDRYFTFEVKVNHKENHFKADKYGDYISILEGNGNIDDLEVKAGDFIMVSSLHEYVIKGKIKFHLSNLV